MLKIYSQGNSVVFELKNPTQVFKRAPGQVQFTRVGNFFKLKDEGGNMPLAKEYLFSNITDQAGTPQGSADLTRDYLTQTLA